MAAEPPPPIGSSPAAEEISAAMAAIYEELFETIPSRVRSYLHEDCVLSILDGSFNAGELALLRAGRIRQVEENRRAFADTRRPELIAIVEGATGREVAASVGQIEAASETAFEIFRLASLAPTLP